MSDFQYLPGDVDIMVDFANALYDITTIPLKESECYPYAWEWACYISDEIGNDQFLKNEYNRRNGKYV